MTCWVWGFPTNMDRVAERGCQSGREHRLSFLSGCLVSFGDSLKWETPPKNHSKAVAAAQFFERDRKMDLVGTILGFCQQNIYHLDGW